MRAITTARWPRLVGFAIVLTVLAQGVQGQQFAPLWSISAVGDGKSLWLIAASGAKQQPVTEICSRGGSDSSWSVLTASRRVAGRVLVATVFRHRLHVIFDSGACRSFDLDPQSPARPEPTPPPRCRPVAMAATSEYLYLLALELPGDASKASAAEDSNKPERFYSLFRLQDNGWQPVPIAPAPPSGARLAMVADEKSLHIFWYCRGAGGGQEAVPLHHISLTGEQWKAPRQVGSLPRSCERIYPLYLGLKGRLLMVMAVRAGARTYRYEAAELVVSRPAMGQARPVVLDSKPLAGSLERVAVAAFREAVAVVRITGPRRLRCQLWTMRGQLRDELEQVDSFANLNRPVKGLDVYVVVLVLAVLAVAVAISGRGSLPSQPLQLPERLRLAPLSRRLLAAAVDAVPGVAAAGLFGRDGLAQLWRELSDHTVVGLHLGLTLGVMAVICLVSELTSSTTLGKRLVGLRVWTDARQRILPHQALIRNLLKVVELIFWPMLLLVALTRYRQRLGDILSRTVVVMREEVAPVDRGGSDGPERPPEAR